MLNKLLKRYMPWMDKGRWYHVRIDLIDDTPTAVFDPVFENVSFSENNIIELKFHKGAKYQLIDAKASIKKYIEAFPGLSEIIDLTDIMLPSTNPSIIRVSKCSDSITDYWFFMTPLVK